MSPAKSWEGSIGSTVASVIYGAFYFSWLLPMAPLAEALGLTVIANIAGQFGRSVRIGDEARRRREG